MELLRIENLHVSVEGNEILHGLSLVLNEGDMLALLGPNGHGKSTLLNALMGNPKYEITQGEIFFKGQNITKLGPDERSKLGLFMAFQNPPEIEGVESMDFFKQAINAHREKPVSLFEFYNLLENGYKSVNLPSDMNTRNLNEGFSGGEKKRSEILQMSLLNPSLALLDEIDSGLDVDAIKLVSDCINETHKKGASFIVISHYARLFSLLEPNKAVVIVNGQIALEGDMDLVEKVDKEGYEWIQKELGISIKKEEKVAILGTCAYKKEI